MSKKQFFLGIFLASVFGAIITLAGFQYFTVNNVPVYPSSIDDKINFRFANLLADTNYIVPEGLNFINAAEIATPGVVHIRASVEASGNSRSRDPYEEFFREFFGEPNGNKNRQRGEGMGLGSGVIISSDGYIATNNHVIERADKIKITLDDNREYDAKVVGTDPSTDLALLKIEETDLSFIKFGNSDKVKIGEWVLAVGNPFNLNSTVTAGIISAKARNINILRDRNGQNMQIESFLQTDAAINPGNSGGALVNLKGELVGINTAIATPTGTYAGYAFAVPSALVQKIMNDLREFGIVQRALLGITIRDVDATLADQKGLKRSQGVYIAEVGESSAAKDAGLKEGDVIVAINGIKTNTVAALQEQVARNRPGDKISVTYRRDGKEKTTEATLKNIEGDTKAIKVGGKSSSLILEGASLIDPSKEERQKLNIASGVKIQGLKSGKFKDAGIKDGFIITSVDKKEIKTVDQLVKMMENKKGGVLIEGIYPNGDRAFYGLGW
jgi:serine protease Do